MKIDGKRKGNKIGNFIGTEKKINKWSSKFDKNTRKKFISYYNQRSRKMVKGNFPKNKNQ